MQCLTCGRQAEGRYCKYHDKAFLSLHSHHEVWVRAYGAVPWEAFLEKLGELEETGQWVREVIKTEMKK